jgi:hypothetical protein
MVDKEKQKLITAIKSQQKVLDKAKNLGKKE